MTSSTPSREQCALFRSCDKWFRSNPEKQKKNINCTHLFETVQSAKTARLSESGLGHPPALAAALQETRFPRRAGRARRQALVIVLRVRMHLRTVIGVAAARRRRRYARDQVVEHADGGVSPGAAVSRTSLKQLIEY